MKNLKQTLILLTSIGLIFSCTNEKTENQEFVGIDYQQLSLDVDEHLKSFTPYFETQESLISTYGRFKVEPQSEKSSDDLLITINVDISSDRVEYTIEDLADIYNNEQKVFLLTYFNEAANVKGSELIYVISKHKLKLKSTSFNNEEYDQIFSILDTAEKTVILIEEMLSSSISSKTNDSLSAKGNCFLECMAGKGRNIGRAIAGGAITGGVTGAYIGGTGGTVLLPGIGTATGAVGGAVFGAAGGAISSGIITTFFLAADCAIQCGGSGSASGGGCAKTPGQEIYVCVN
tara:strand:+ start:203 stop:1072 length:870 start_codon:yes stop_codon:yes gene_type:complete